MSRRPGEGEAPTPRPASEAGGPRPASEGFAPPRPPPAAPSGAPGPVPVREALGQVEGAPSEEAAADPGRRFEVEGEGWVARMAGEGAGGTGRAAPAYLVAVHFWLEAEPARPRREALLPRGRFEGLYDEELRGVWERAVEIPPADGRP